MKSTLSFIIALCLAFSLTGCKKELRTEQKIANLEKSSQELAEAARRTKEEYDRVKQQNQDYLEAYAKASGKK